MWNSITDVTGIEVGHYSDLVHATGCTVVMAPEGAVGGVDVRGSAPGTRETDLLRAENMVDQVHAILLSGGSAFGLDAATGVVRYLEEKGIGYRAGPAVVPIVAGAILFDLGLVTDKVRPGAAEGYLACMNAASGFVQEGTTGAGVGAVVGKALGRSRGMKGGVGTSSIDMGHGIVVGALVAVNAIGGVVDPDTGQLLAGPIADDQSILNSVDVFTAADYVARRDTHTMSPIENTAIGVVATNATLTKGQANKLAQISHDGLALAIRPCHTMHDGDTMFALATSKISGTADMIRLCAAVPRVVSLAVVRAIQTAESLAGIPSWKEIMAGD